MRLHPLFPQHLSVHLQTAIEQLKAIHSIIQIIVINVTTKGLQCRNLILITIIRIIMEDEAIQGMGCLPCLFLCPALFTLCHIQMVHNFY